MPGSWTPYGNCSTGANTWWSSDEVLVCKGLIERTEVPLPRTLPAAGAPTNGTGTTRHLSACDTARWRLAVTGLFLAAPTAHLKVTAGSTDLWISFVLPTVKSDQAENLAHDLSQVRRSHRDVLSIVCRHEPVVNPGGCPDDNDGA